MSGAADDQLEGSAQDDFSQGNERFLAKDYLQAAACYTRAIQKDRQNATLFSNRSACYTRVRRFKSAVADAQQCIRLQPEWPKGYYRLALGN